MFCVFIGRAPYYIFIIFSVHEEERVGIQIEMDIKHRARKPYKVPRIDLLYILICR